MRARFHTTIDKDLLQELKKEALLRNVDANDIIEELLRNRYERENSNEYSDKIC